LVTTDDTIQGAINAQLGDDHEDELDNRLLQFIGVGETLEAHIYQVADAGSYGWLVTSDGAHGLGRRVLEGLVERPLSPSELVRRFIYVADALNVRDNASVAALRTEWPTSLARPSTGVELAIWSPVDHFSAWLAVEVDTADVNGSSAASPITPPPLEAEAKPGKSKQKSRPRPKRSRVKGEKEPEKPPMAVIFDQGLPKDD
jgi:hypothetical protein